MKSKKCFFAVILALAAFVCTGCSGLFTPGTTDVTVCVDRSLVADRAASSSIGTIKLFMYNADSKKQIGSATVDVAESATTASATFSSIELQQKAYVTAQFYLTTGKAYGDLITSSTETISTNTAFTMTVSVTTTGTSSFTTTPVLSLADSSGTAVSSIAYNSTDSLTLSLTGYTTSSSTASYTWYINETAITGDAWTTFVSGIEPSGSETTTMSDLVTALGDSSQYVNIGGTNIIKVTMTENNAVTASASLSLTITEATETAAVSE